MYRNLNIICLLIFAISNNCIGQHRYYGHVHDVTNHQLFTTTTKPASHIKIYAQNRSCQGAVGILVFESDSSYFDFTIAQQALDTTTYFLFETKYNYESAHIKYVKENKDIAIYAGQALKVKAIDEPQIIADSIEHYLAEKPAIYLYPKKEMDINVHLKFAGKIQTTYPLYLNGWNVIASPNGKLFNKNDRRNYSYLFWDGSYTFPKSHYKFTEGFTVKKEDYIPFLESKLQLIGLNETETNDFIVYWLPRLNNFDYCQMRFNINDDIFGTAQINTNPSFDSQIRVFMEFKGFNGAFTEASPLMMQSLPALKRIGFTLVEWGGSEMESTLLK